MPHPEWSAMSSEQKMEFLYNWCFQMSEVVQELRATTQTLMDGRGDGRGAAIPDDIQDAGSSSRCWASRRPHGLWRHGGSNEHCPSSDC